MQIICEFRRLKSYSKQGLILIIIYKLIFSLFFQSTNLTKIFFSLHKPYIGQNQAFLDSWAPLCYPLKHKCHWLSHKFVKYSHSAIQLSSRSCFILFTQKLQNKSRIFAIFLIDLKHSSRSVVWCYKTQYFHSNWSRIEARNPQKVLFFILMGLLYRLTQ